MEAIILAGGLGTRLRSAVPDLPKPMAPIAGKPFLQYLLDYWIAQGVSHAILSTGYKHDLIRRHFGAEYGGVPLTYAVESEPLGTGGGLLLAMQFLTQSDPCLVLNGDTFFEVDLEKFRNNHWHCASDWSVALRRVPHNSRYGSVEIDETGKIVSFCSQSTHTNNQIINGGIYLVNQPVLDGLSLTPGEKLSLEEDIFSALLKARKNLYGFVFEKRFIDIGIPDDYYAAATVLNPT